MLPAGRESQKQKPASAGFFSYAALINPLRQLRGTLLPFAVAIGQVVTAPARQQSELHQLFHYVHDAVVVRRRLHATIFIKFGPGFCHG